MKYCILILYFIIPTVVFSQTIDVRRSLWGATVAEVKKAELPLNPILERDSNFVAQKQANKILSYQNVVVEKQLANIDYFFRNDKLISITFTIFQNRDSITNDLYTKQKRIQGVFNKLMLYKNMKPVYCWTYDYGSFKQQSGKVSCSFADQTTASEIEKYAIELLHIKRALFVLGNERTLASFEFDIKNNNKEILCWLNFNPTNKVEQTIQSTDF